MVNMADLWNAEPGDIDLHGDTDAQNWAQRFALGFEVTRRPKRLPPVAIGDAEFTAGVMLTWFASAIETGRLAQAAVQIEEAPPPVLPLPDSAMVRVTWNDGEAHVWVDIPRATFDDKDVLVTLPGLLDEAMLKLRGDEGNDEI